MAKRGFTLIELLIVVAIIGVLAAIAVPNFLNAQIRAKVSRVMSDMKALEVALESYRIDEGNYPNWTERIVPVTARYIRLTTPVAYIASVPLDPFYSLQTHESGDLLGGYDYVNVDYNQSNADWTCLWGHWWRISGYGPDQWNDWGGCRETREGRKGSFNCNNGIPNFQYQSSNGLVSDGDVVWVGQRNDRSRLRCRVVNGI